MPVIGLITAVLVPFALRMIDTGFTGDIYRTKQTSLAKYKEIYSGKDHLIHFKFSDALNVTYVAMMYGVGQPLLFPIAAFNLMMQWVCEKMAVSWITKLPPTMDDQMTQNAIGMLKLAPLLLLCNGYWMLSNQQIFLNQWSFKRFEDETMRSGHYIIDLSINWAVPMKFIIICAVIVILIQVICSNHLQQWGFTMQRYSIAVDENLPNFFQALKFTQANELVQEYKNIKDNYGFEIEDPSVIAQLRN